MTPAFAEPLRMQSATVCPVCRVTPPGSVSGCSPAGERAPRTARIYLKIFL